jgi:5-methylcytosine-specific restriction endonuclease McrA
MHRDGRRCQWLRADTGEICGLEASDVDHIEPGDNHDLSNLQALCRFHHLRKTGGETAGARPARARPVPRHPGLLG